MRTSQDEQDVRIGFSFIDSAYATKIGWDVIGIYVILRRFAWRKYDSGSLGEHLSDGRIVCSVSYRKVAAMMGVSHSYVVRRMKILMSFGWLKREKDQYNQGQNIYTLGTRRSWVDGDKTHIEDMFYADTLAEVEIGLPKKKKKK
jgi:hypothetical protein